MNTAVAQITAAQEAAEDLSRRLGEGWSVRTFGKAANHVRATFLPVPGVQVVVLPDTNGLAGYYNVTVTSVMYNDKVTGPDPLQLVKECMIRLDDQIEDLQSIAAAMKKKFA